MVPTAVSDDPVQRQCHMHSHCGVSTSGSQHHRPPTGDPVPGVLTTQTSLPAPKLTMTLSLSSLPSLLFSLSSLFPLSSPFYLFFSSLGIGSLAHPPGGHRCCPCPPRNCNPTALPARHRDLLCLPLEQPSSTLPCQQEGRRVLEPAFWAGFTPGLVRQGSLLG